MKICICRGNGTIRATGRKEEVQTFSNLENSHGTYRKLASRDAYTAYLRKNYTYYFNLDTGVQACHMKNGMMQFTGDRKSIEALARKAPNCQIYYVTSLGLFRVRTPKKATLYI